MPVGPAIAFRVAEGLGEIRTLSSGSRLRRKRKPPYRGIITGDPGFDDRRAFSEIALWRVCAASVTGHYSPLACIWEGM